MQQPWEDVKDDFLDRVAIDRYESGLRIARLQGADIVTEPAGTGSNLNRRAVAAAANEIVGVLRSRLSTFPPPTPYTKKEIAKSLQALWSDPAVDKADQAFITHLSEIPSNEPDEQSQSS